MSIPEPRAAPRQAIKDDANVRSSAAQSSAQQSIFTIPAPVKRVFDKFPLVTYAANKLPFQVAATRDHNTLLVYTTAEAAAAGAPSFDPNCLKWQTLLKIYGVPFKIQPSNIHASAGASLPVLIPSSGTSSTSQELLPPSRIASWIRAHSSEAARAPADSLHEALLMPIRDALRYSFQLSANTSHLRKQSSRSQILDETLAWLAQCDAEEEITRSSGAAVPKVDGEALYHEAIEALEALAAILGADVWFGRRKESRTSSVDSAGAEDNQVPGMLDAAVFAYAHVILDFLDDETSTRSLSLAVRQHENLVEHRDRVLEVYF